MQSFFHHLRMRRQRCSPHKFHRIYNRKASKVSKPESNRSFAITLLSPSHSRYHNLIHYRLELPSTQQQMFCQSSSEVSLPRGPRKGAGTSVSAMDISDDSVGTAGPSSSAPNNNTADLIGEDNLIDDFAFLPESFQVVDGGGEMVDDDMFFDLFDVEDADEDPTSAGSATQFPTFTSSSTSMSAKAPNDHKKGSSTVEQIRSLEAKLTKSMQRTSMSRAVIQDSRAQLSRSSFVSHASTTLSLMSTATADDATASPPSPHVTSTPSITPNKVACTAAFLTGKRSTITPALEQSRKKLKMYMEQLDMSSY